MLLVAFLLRIPKYIPMVWANYMSSQCNITCSWPINWYRCFSVQSLITLFVFPILAGVKKRVVVEIGLFNSNVTFHIIVELVSPDCCFTEPDSIPNCYVCAVKWCRCVCVLACVMICFSNTHILYIYSVWSAEHEATLWNIWRSVMGFFLQKSNEISKQFQYNKPFCCMQFVCCWWNERRKMGELSFRPIRFDIIELRKSSAMKCTALTVAIPLCFAITL